MTPKQVLQLYPPHGYTLPGLLASRGAVASEREALQFEARSWTYAELDSAVASVAQRLRTIGLGRGESLAHIATNSDIAAVLYLALARIGAVFVPMNVELSDVDLGYMLHNSGALVICCGPADVGRFSRIAADLRPSPAIHALDQFGLGAASSAEAARIMASTLPAGAAQSDVAAGPDDSCLVIYTSGTTGFPKGVVHTHRSYILSAEAFVTRQELQPEDRLLSVLPMFHANAMFYSLGGALAAGGAFITTVRFSASGFWTLAVETGATQFNFIAALGNILMLRPRSEFDPRHRIRKIYGGPISAEMYRVFEQEFNVPNVIEGYGMSEIPATCCNPYHGPHKVGSIGPPNKHPLVDGAFTDVRIEDDTGNVLAPGQSGELTVRTPTQFHAYLNEPEQTSAAFRNGWFRTGDLARIDADGYVFLAGRMKDIIRRRGENISGAELDRVMATHPEIAEAATIGVPAELGDDELLVVLVAKPDCSPSYESVLAWSRTQLAAIKVPRFLLLVESLPHTPTHRVAKQVLRQDLTLRERAFDAEAGRVSVR